MSANTQTKNKRMAVMVVFAVAVMVGLTFASVPLYRLFCQVTGFGGTPSIDVNATSSAVLDREMTIRFNADVSRDMPWDFAPEQKSVNVKIGQKNLISFRAHNNGKEAIEGTAIYNVLPQEAGEYFHKTQCFCFGQQILKPDETAEMPVVFFVDPSIVDDPDLREVKTITLSYTFFKAGSAAYDAALDKFVEGQP